MLFPIQYIKHDIEKVHEIPEHFFRELQKGEITTFCAELFPEWMREKGFKGKIRSRFEELYNAIQVLPKSEQQKLYQAFFDSNQIEEICGDISLTATSIDDLPESIRSITKDTFVWLYEYILTHKKSPITKILKTSIHNHYGEYEKLNSRVCPFCGLESIKLSESEGRADYDHYFHKSDYPFSTVNMKGLIPAGEKCNKLKGTTDVLHDESGNKILVFYPFSFSKEYGRDYEFILRCPQKPSKNYEKGEWKIDLSCIVSDNDLNIQLTNWNRIFNISSRYAEHIKKGNIAWLRDFMFDRKNVFKSLKIQRSLVIKELENHLLLSRPTIHKIKSDTNIIPRFLYFKFLKDDEDFAIELVRLFVEKPPKVGDDLQL